MSHDENSRIYCTKLYNAANRRAASPTFRIYITAEINSIVFRYFYLVKSRDLSIELLTISTDNIWNLCGIELKDNLI